MIIEENAGKVRAASLSGPLNYDLKESEQECKMVLYVRSTEAGKAMYKDGNYYRKQTNVDAKHRWSILPMASELAAGTMRGAQSWERQPDYHPQVIQSLYGDRPEGASLPIQTIDWRMKLHENMSGCGTCFERRAKANYSQVALLNNKDISQELLSIDAFFFERWPGKIKECGKASR